MRAYIVFNL